MELAKITSLSPKQIGIVVAVGVGAGLILRQRNKPVVTSDSSASEISSDTDTGYDVSTEGAPIAQPAPDSAELRRDMGTIQLPVAKYLVTIGGQQYLYDGTSYEPYPTTPAATTAATPTTTVSPRWRKKQSVKSSSPVGKPNAANILAAAKKAANPKGIGKIK